MPENFDPLREAGVLELWEGPVRPWPGVEMITAEGHTRGQQLVRVEGGGSAAYFVADLIPTASHVRIPYVMGYDVAAIETMAEKRAAARARGGRAARGSCSSTTPTPRMARPVEEGDDFAWSERVAATALTAAG